MERKDYSNSNRDLAKIAFEEQERTRAEEKHLKRFQEELFRVKVGEIDEADLLSIDFVDGSDPLELWLPAENGIKYRIKDRDFRERIMGIFKGDIVTFASDRRSEKVPEKRTKYLKDYAESHPGVTLPYSWFSYKLKSEPGSLVMITRDTYYFKYDRDIKKAETWTAKRIQYDITDQDRSFGKEQETEFELSIPVSRQLAGTSSSRNK